ncbi:phasin family protein [Terasakiella pusilla]
MTTPANKTTATNPTKAEPAKRTPARHRAAASKAAAQKAPAKTETVSASEKAAPTSEAAPKTEVKAPVAKAAPKAAAPKTPAQPKAEPAPKEELLPASDLEVQIEHFSSQLQEGYNDMMQFGKEQMEKFFKFEGMDAFKNMDAFKSYEDIMAFSKENVDAFVKSSSIAAKGVQDVTTLVSEIAKANLEGNVEVTKKIFECKNPQEVAALQQELLKTGYDKFVADASRIQEASTKIAEEAAKPLKERFEAGVEKASEKVA